MISIDQLKASDGTGDATVATILNARPPGSTTCQVDSISGFNGRFIATSGTPNAVTGIIESNVLVFEGYISGGNVVIDTIAPGYTDEGNAVDDIIVIKPSTHTQDKLAEILEISLEDDGTLNEAALAQIENDPGIQESRRTPRILVDDTEATLTPNIDDYNYYRLTAQAGALSIAAPTGTPNDGDGLLIEIQDNGTSRALTWNAIYEADSVYGLALPTATVINKTHFLTFVWNDLKDKWVWIA